MGPTQAELDEFIDGYEAAMWWTNAYEYDNGELQPYEGLAGVTGEYANGQYAKLRSAAEDFAMENFDIIREAIATRDDFYGWNFAGHDFALTRNGHGVGFWDRGLGAVGDALADVAKLHGEQYLLQDTDDGTFYVQG